MTRKRINRLIDLVKKADDKSYEIQAEITIGKEIRVIVYDYMSGNSLSMYYETDKYVKCGKHPTNDRIITLYDPDLTKAERYLLAIIKRYEEGGGDGD